MVNKRTLEKSTKTARELKLMSTGA